MRLVFIGASAGSICSLEKIIKALTKLEGAVIMAVHLHESYIDGFVEILQQNASIPVQKVTPQTIIQKNHIYICNSKNSTVYKSIDGNEVLCNESYQESIYTPDIDRLFLSIASNKKDLHDVMAILLSGIGDNGIVGLKSLKKGGATTIVAAKESAAVYGMPKRAVEEKACEQVLNLHQIIVTIEKFLDHA
ncbi:chemotaxis protein CheB [Nitratiruptor sp. YY09-18]|uniref:chemotaxis protein CheB n=1 Tax=Nitratiruptor sp. YY09-18 TaxID=2724901 RepID=UPI001916511D|nr:chemotaxis protein CheB [Nitratiruptor sp. YY09-18]BCD68004.1 two-component system, chemotaxis family, protein-glutamate methylesterase/glutaminase [Nitratiruptor sp. YY09-18]